MQPFQVVKPLYNLSSPLREQFGESAVELAYRIYQQSVFFGTFTPDPDNLIMVKTSNQIHFELLHNNI